MEAAGPSYAEGWRPGLSALAELTGGPLAPAIHGTVWFYAWHNGTWVCVEVWGLPPHAPGDDAEPVGPHGFHIHENGTCEAGHPTDPFQAAGEHWNPTGQPHGNHAGDFPVLFSNDGYALACFFTNRFTPSEALGRSVIIHENPDDYRSQPAGNSGRRLACGVIRRPGSSVAPDRGAAPPGAGPAPYR